MSDARNRLLNIIQDKYGKEKHPILVMAEIAFDEATDAKLRLDASKSIMPYIEAQRKAVEIKGDMNLNTGLLRVSMVDDVDKEDEGE